jgi:hypothetical protein
MDDDFFKAPPLSTWLVVIAGIINLAARMAGWSMFLADAILGVAALYAAGSVIRWGGRWIGRAVADLREGFIEGFREARNPARSKEQLGS